MENVPYEVLDHSISSAILAHNEVIRRNNELRTQYCPEPLRFYLRDLLNKQFIQVNSEYPRYKPNYIKQPLHHEYRQKNNG
ncbi:32871_t:CDS:2 [Gigaspora margarita]|uniref:32871_t:CDS:1 n=1 Tax=Gigaspora margarita TaxID=4874 RepID=A0ABN7VKC1_GIGMA|nr:32871_t:CDS:2 [Gigaspora margarita]